MKIIKTFSEPQTIIIVDGYISEGREQDLKLTDDECMLVVKSDLNTARLDSFGYVYIMTKEEFIDYSKTEDCNSENGDNEGFEQYIVINDFSGNIGIDTTNKDFDLNNLDMNEYLYWQDYDSFLKIEGDYKLTTIESLNETLEIIEKNESSLLENEIIKPLEFYQDSKKEWKWRIKTSKGKIIALSYESYKDKDECLYNASLVSKNLSHDLKYF